ncbi:MAG: lytic transglycosylase domain-containing protein [Terriglobia bacterium]
MGLMQLIPATAQRFGVENPFDPGQNIRGGVTFLHYLLHRFNGSVPLSLAAYNAGEYRVGRDGEIPPIPETINYVRKVTSIYHAPSAPRAGLPASTPGQPAVPIYHYMDAYGVVHFSND